jgi:hypothetical protein
MPTSFLFVKKQVDTEQVSFKSQLSILLRVVARNIHFSFMPSSPWDIEITKYINYTAFYITINKTMNSRMTA